MDFDTKVDVLHATIKARDKFQKELLNIATTETDDEELMTEFDDIVKAHCLDIALDFVRDEADEEKSIDVPESGKFTAEQYREMIQMAAKRLNKPAEEKPDEIDEKKELSGFESMLKFAETENGRKVLVDAYKVFLESQKEQRK